MLKHNARKAQGVVVRSFLEHLWSAKDLRWFEMLMSHLLSIVGHGSKKGVFPNTTLRQGKRSGPPKNLFGGNPTLGCFSFDPTSPPERAFPWNAATDAFSSRLVLERLRRRGPHGHVALRHAGDQGGQLKHLAGETFPWHLLLRKSGKKQDIQPKIALLVLSLAFAEV